MDAIFWLVAFIVLSSVFDKRRRKTPAAPAEEKAPMVLPTNASADELRQQVRERMAQRAQERREGTPTTVAVEGSSKELPRVPSEPSEALYDEETTPENEGSYAGGVNIPAALLAAESRLKSSQDALALAQKQISNATSRAYQGAVAVVTPAGTTLAGLFASRGGLQAAFVAGEILGTPKALR